MDGFDLAAIIKIIAGSHLSESAYKTDNRITYTRTGTFANTVYSLPSFFTVFISDFSPLKPESSTL